MDDSSVTFSDWGEGQEDQSGENYAFIERAENSRWHSGAESDGNWNQIAMCQKAIPTRKLFNQILNLGKQDKILT